MAAEPALRRPSEDGLYEADYYAWVQAQVSALERGDMAALDVTHLADEVADLGRSEKHRVESNLNALLLHLVKWMCQPDRRKGGWEVSIREHRKRLLRDLADSPSLKRHASEIVAEEYDLARRRAAVRMQPRDTIPEHCPFTIAQILDPEFLP